MAVPKAPSPVTIKPKAGAIITIPAANAVTPAIIVCKGAGKFANFSKILVKKFTNGVNAGNNLVPIKVEKFSIALLYNLNESGGGTSISLNLRIALIITSVVSTPSLLNCFNSLTLTPITSATA